MILPAASFLMLLGLGIFYVVAGHASSLIYLSACILVVVVFMAMLLQWRSFTPLAGFLLISFAIGSFSFFAFPHPRAFLGMTAFILIEAWVFLTLAVRNCLLLKWK